MTDMTPQLYRENMVIIEAMDALSPFLTSSVRGLYLDFEPEDVVVAHFVLSEPSPEDEAEILEEFSSELSSLTYGIPDVGEASAHPVIHFDGVESIPTSARCVFQFRD